MRGKQEKIVTQLEEILTKNRDAVDGYDKAAENSNSLGLKMFFLKKASERDLFNENLKNEMVTSYIEIKDEGSFTGTIHRVWMDVKALVGDSDEAMLEEAIKGDKAAMEEYDEILQNAELPTNIAELIRTQKNQIHSGLDMIKRLEDIS